MAARRSPACWFRLARYAPPLVGLLLLAAVLWRAWSAERPLAEFEFRDGRIESVRRVVDGRTLELASGIRVRLIGLEAPLDESYRTSAVEFLREQIEGRDVELRFDRERVDRDENVLAFVYVEGACVNESLLAAGRARLIPRAPFSSTLQRSFAKAEEAARANGRGLWAKGQSRQPASN